MHDTRGRHFSFLYRKLELAGRYRNATQVDIDLGKIKRQESARRYRLLKSCQLDDALQLEKDHQQAFLELQHRWDERMVQVGRRQQLQQDKLASHQASKVSDLKQVHLQTAAYSFDCA